MTPSKPQPPNGLAAFIRRVTSSQDDLLLEELRKQWRAAPSEGTPTTASLAKATKTSEDAVRSRLARLAGEHRVVKRKAGPRVFWLPNDDEFTGKG